MKTLWQKFLRYDAWSAMVWYMAALLAYSFYSQRPGWEDFGYVILLIAVAVFLDYLLHRFQKTGRKGFPQSGLITALIVAVLLPAKIGLLPGFMAMVLAITSKHFILWRHRHVFNPAAFGALVSMLIFGFPLGWRADGFAWLVIPLGVFAAWRVKKPKRVASFVLIYLAFLVWQGSLVALNQYSIFLVPWFFALFMLPEPMTSPAGAAKELAFGTMVAALFIIFTQFTATAELALLLALLSANFLRLLFK